MSSSASNTNEKQFQSLHTKAMQAKELENESKYKQLFIDLIVKKKSQIVNAIGSSDEYGTETNVLKKALDIERNAIVSSVAVGITAFLTIRYLPHVAIRLIGGESRLNALREAEKKAKKAPNALFKSIGSFLFESTLGFWAAYRGYHLALDMKSDDVYDDLVNLPLCTGKSQVSDVICNEWINIVNYQISDDFWANVNHNSSGGNLKNEDFFRAVLGFKDACMKRRRYEEAIRKRDGLDPMDCIFIPEPGIPTDILELSDEEVEAIVRHD